MIDARVRHSRSRSPVRLWDMQTAPERSRKVQIQTKVDEVSQRRAITQRLPLLGHNVAAVSGREIGRRGGMRHAEIASIVAGTGGHKVPKTPAVLRGPTNHRAAQNSQRRPITVRTMCAVLTDSGL